MGKTGKIVISLFIAIFIIGATITFVISNLVSSKYNNRVNNSEVIKSTVVELLEVRGSDGDYLYKPLYEFNYNGKTYRVKDSIASYPPTFDKGNIVDLYVLKSDPYDVLAVSATRYKIVINILNVLGWINTVLAAILLIILFAFGSKKSYKHNEVEL